MFTDICCLSEQVQSLNSLLLYLRCVHTWAVHLWLENSGQMATPCQNSAREPVRVRGLHLEGAWPQGFKDLLLRLCCFSFCCRAAGLPHGCRLPFDFLVLFWLLKCYLWKRLSPSQTVRLGPFALSTLHQICPAALVRGVRGQLLCLATNCLKCVEECGWKFMPPPIVCLLPSKFLDFSDSRPNCCRS